MEIRVLRYFLAIAREGSITNASEDSPLCFKPLYPPLESGLNLIWKKYQIFSPAAAAFLEKLQNKWNKGDFA